MVDEARVQREQEAYDTGLQRGRYEDVLSHTNAYWRPTISARIQAISDANGTGDVLEIGSTSWRRWIDSAAVKPRRLVCINISQAEIDRGQKVGARVSPEFLLMDAHKLEFEDESFDYVFGGGILHHLDYDIALSEIQRVLRPGGVMAFSEPLNINPIAKIVRALTPKARTDDEAPIEFSHVAIFKEHFDVEFGNYGLTSVPAGLVSRLLRLKPKNPITWLAFQIDKGIAAIPGLKWLCRSTIIVGRKPG